MEFFSQVPGAILTLSFFEKLITISFIPIAIPLTNSLFQNQLYLKVVKGVLILTMLLFYGWYITKGFPLNEALPLYHCRLGMFALLLLSDNATLKAYFAQLGISGAILAIILPDLYPYPLFHITHAFFYVGHLSLLVLSHHYLLKVKPSIPLTQVITYTVIIHGLILIPNLLWDANYSFLAITPLIHTQNLVLNYVLVTAVVCFLIKFTEKIYVKVRSK